MSYILYILNRDGSGIFRSKGRQRREMKYKCKYWLQEVRTHLDLLLLNYGDHTENLPSSLWLEFGRRLDSQPMMLVDHGQNYHSL